MKGFLLLVGLFSVIQASFGIRNEIIDTRRLVVEKIQRCVEHDRELHSTVERLLYQSRFDEALSELKYVEGECLRGTEELVEHYYDLHAKLERSSTSKPKLLDFVTPAQLQSLRALFEKHGNEFEITQRLERFFDGFSSDDKAELVRQFFDYDSGSSRRARSASDSEESVEKPEADAPKVPEPKELKIEWLKWMTPRQKNIIHRMRSAGATQWEILQKIGQLFYSTKKSKRVAYKKNLQLYCVDNLKAAIGDGNMEKLEKMFYDNEQVDELEAKFQEIIAGIQGENNRLLAEHYGEFCRRVFRLVDFEPAELTSWLTPSQKTQLGTMIQDPNIGDDLVYEKVSHFYANAKDDQKEDAQEVIETGCRQFIAHMFGDEVADNLEERRLSNASTTHSQQSNAALLASHIREISSEDDRKRAQTSMPLCIRIYLAFNGSCFCNHHSDTCDPQTFACTGCGGNTEGVQCEKCVGDFVGDALTGECHEQQTMAANETAATTTETRCECNNHAMECNRLAVCLKCQHNTEGASCERCAPGYYGDAQAGSPDDCTKCPCAIGGCHVEDGLVRCHHCPEGKTGFTCDQIISNATTTKTIVV